MTQLGPRSFPLSGLKELEPEWQESVSACRAWTIHS
jgi:hypothetical protein